MSRARDSEIADTEEADARREHVAEGQRGKRRVAAGAATLDGQPIAVDVATIDKVAGRPHAIVDIHDAPSAVQRLPVRTTVARAATVVDVHYGDAP